jgi:hypothetical protein
MTGQDSFEFDAQQDPPRDTALARALRVVDGADVGIAEVSQLRDRIVHAAGAAAPSPWVAQVAQPARRALPWAMMLAAASLAFALLSPIAASDDGWSNDVLGEPSVDVSLGLPTSPEALLQETLSR